MVEPARSASSPVQPPSRNGTSPEPVDQVDPADALVAPIGDAIAALPRPALSPVFRARLHGELVRLEAQLADERSRPARRWAVIPFRWPLPLLRPRSVDRSADRSATAYVPSDARAKPRRLFGTALGLPAMLALSLTVALFTAAGLAYAAEHSAPGDALWPVHSAIVRWRTGRAPAAPESRDPASPSPIGAVPAPGVRSVAAATVARRTRARQVATSGPVLPRSASADDVSPAVARFDGLEPPNPLIAPQISAIGDPTSDVGAVPPELQPSDDPNQPPAGEATAQPDVPPVAAPPVRPRDTDTPRATTPASASPNPTSRTSPPSPTLQTPPTPTPPPPSIPPTPTMAAPPDSATLAGTVRLRDGNVVVPLAGVTIGLAPVATDFPAGCDPFAPPAVTRTAVTDADGAWAAGVPPGRWIVSASGGCLGAPHRFLVDFNGATTTDACAALALPVSDGTRPSADLVVDAAGAPGCAPTPTATATP